MLPESGVFRYVFKLKESKVVFGFRQKRQNLFIYLFHCVITTCFGQPIITQPSLQYPEHGATQ